MPLSVHFTLVLAIIIIEHCFQILCDAGAVAISSPAEVWNSGRPPQWWVSGVGGGGRNRFQHEHGAPTCESDQGQVVTCVSGCDIHSGKDDMVLFSSRCPALRKTIGCCGGRGVVQAISPKRSWKVESEGRTAGVGKCYRCNGCWKSCRRGGIGTPGLGVLRGGRGWLEKWVLSGNRPIHNSTSLCYISLCSGCWNIA